MKNNPPGSLFTKFSCIILFVTGLTSAGKAQPADQALKSGKTILNTVKSEKGSGISISLPAQKAVYEQLRPMAIEIVDENNLSSWKQQPYEKVSVVKKTFVCQGKVTTQNGSVFTFRDIYRSFDNAGTYQVSRSVKVEKASPKDKGFSSRLAFQQPGPSSMKDYDFFVPGVWYKDNKDVSPTALASDYSDNDYWFREDRLPLPLIMLMEKQTGITLSVFHQNGDGRTFKEEKGLERIIDARLKFASLGMHNNRQPLVGIQFPGTEGERTGIDGMKNQRKWAYRSNPVAAGYTQTYQVIVRLSGETDYISALKNTWNNCYRIQNPDYYKVDLNKVYQQQIDILNKYWRSINNTAGVPFRIRLNGNVVDADYNWDMGFVGQEISNAALLIREGIHSKNDSLRIKGEQMVDFWANESIAPSGIPRTWYDPSPATWRKIPTHLRTLGDGMNGLLYAWNLEKKNGIDKRKWLNTAGKIADWLLSVQNEDGSFYQQFDYQTGEIKNDTKNNTSNIVPFLVDMYNVTGEEQYKKAAGRAGDFIFGEIYQKFRYAGGAADNPNVPDKEAVSMALRAFLALYDLQKDKRWIEAGKQAAYYYQTWVYSWPVPIPADDDGTVFPKSRSVTGLSLIATSNNSADTYAAIDAFNIFRVYLYSKDPDLLNFSRLLLKNTKQYMNWDSNDPISGFAPGFLGEAMRVTIPRGHGVDYFLPWQTNNLLEPMVLFKDVFGYYDVDDIQRSAPAVVEDAHSKFSSHRGFEHGNR